MRLPPKVDIAAVRSEAAAHAASKSAALGKLVEVLNAAVSREESRSAPKMPPAIKVVSPVVVVLEPGSRALRGLMPVDAAERGALNAFIKDLPVHIAINPREVIGTIRQGLESSADAKGMTILDVTFEQRPRKPLQLRVQRAHQSMLAAFEPEAKDMVSEALQRIVAGLPRHVSLGDLTLNATDTIGRGLLRMVHAYKNAGTKSWKQQVKLSAEEVEALAHGRGITTEQPLPEIVADVMRYVLSQPEPRDWAHFMPVTYDQLAVIKDSFVREHGIATLQELATPRDYAIPRIFERPLSRLPAEDRPRAMSAIVARVRSDYDHSDESFKSSIGVSREDAGRMIDGTLEYSPVPVLEVVTKLLGATKLRDDAKWWLYTDVGNEELSALRQKLSAARSESSEAELEVHHTFTATELLSAVSPQHRPLVAECLSVVTHNKFLHDEAAFTSVFKVPRKAFTAMLGGASLASPLSPRQLCEAVMSYVCDADKRYYGELMSFSRVEVREALDALRAA